MAKFAALKAEANKGTEPTKPYVIDDVDPPIEITAPTDFDRSVGLAELITSEGEFETRYARRIVELFCGDAFPAVHKLIGKEHLRVTIALVNDLIEHFKQDLDTEAADAPGGSAASPS